MKKILILLIMAAVVAVAGIGYLILGNKGVAPKTASSNSASTNTPNVTDFKKACAVMTQADAEAVLGAGSTKSDSSGSADVITSERSVTTCNYKTGSANNLKQATLLLRASAPSEAKSGFNGARLADATDVSDLGEAAYWSPTYGQLNVLKGNTWMIVSVGGARVSEHSQADSKVLASRLISKL